MAKRSIKIGGIYIGYGGKYVFESLTGFENGDAEREQINYIDTDGAEMGEAYFNPRSIEIKGTILASSQNELEILKRQLIKVCNPKEEVDLYYNNGVNTYYAKATGDGLPEFGKPKGRGCWYVDFIAYLILPSFYWLTDSEIQTNIFEVTALLTSETELPAIFSERTNVAQVINDGEVEAYPKIVIECEVPNTTDVVIKNTTTGQTLSIKYIMAEGEIITIDMFEMSVTSNTNGNLLNTVTKDSVFFSYFVGENNIVCYTDSVHVISLHRNRYMGV